MIFLTKIHKNIEEPYKYLNGGQRLMLAPYFIMISEFSKVAQKYNERGSYGKTTNYKTKDLHNIIYEH